MADEDFTRAGDILKFGDDQVRVEIGWRRVTATATKELLHDDNSHPDYFAGTRPMPFRAPSGQVIEIDAPGRDSMGKEIKLGEEITILDRGGAQSNGSKEFIIFKKVPVDPTKETLRGGLPNPHYVPEMFRKGLMLADDGTPPNRTHFTYVFEQVEEVPVEDWTDPDSYAEAEAKAIERARAILAKMEA
jgi:hypothetical protein